MKIPESRFQSNTSRSPRRLLVVVAVAVLAGLLVTAALLLVRSRTPMLAIGQTEKPQSAIEMWNQERYDEVVTLTTEQLGQFPLDPTALTLRGFSRFYLAMDAVDTDGRHDLLVGAIRDLRRVLLLPNPELEPQIHYVLGKAYFHRGEFFYDSATTELVAARDQGVVRLDLLEYLALASRDLGRTDDAIGYFHDAIELGDEAIHRVTLADILIGEGRYSEADALLSRAIDQTEDTTILQDALLSLGRSYRLQERFDESIDVYQRILEINESSAEAHFGIGEVYLAQGEQDRARFEWREAIRLDPNHIESLQRLQEY
tara:strand:- start:1381 stop:2328 length:948 start_codon:yes stop_codon:yes gene_type:complete